MRDESSEWQWTYIFWPVILLVYLCDFLFRLEASTFCNDCIKQLKVNQTIDAIQMRQMIENFKLKVCKIGWAFVWKRLPFSHFFCLTLELKVLEKVQSESDLFPSARLASRLPLSLSVWNTCDFAFEHLKRVDEGVFLSSILRCRVGT